MAYRFVRKQIVLFCRERHGLLRLGRALQNPRVSSVTEKQWIVRSAGRWKGRDIDEEGCSED